MSETKHATDLVRLRLVSNHALHLAIMAAQALAKVKATNIAPKHVVQAIRRVSWAMLPVRKRWTSRKLCHALPCLAPGSLLRRRTRNILWLLALLSLFCFLTVLLRQPSVSKADKPLYL